MSVNTYALSNGDLQLSPHFSLHEFQSHINGSDRQDCILVNDKLITMLEQLYTALHCSSMTISSGYRTPSHSLAVGGYATDQHTKGNAADILCYDSNQNLISHKLVCCAAQDLGFPGIGYGGTYVHVDVRDGYWHGDETNGANVSDYYDYFGIARNTDTEDRLQYEINRAYLTLTGANADADGLQNWTANLSNGSVSWKQFYDQLSESDTAIRKYLTDVCFLGELGRKPSEQELSDRLYQYRTTDVTKASWLEEFHNSEEARNHRK